MTTSSRGIGTCNKVKSLAIIKLAIGGLLAIIEIILTCEIVLAWDNGDIEKGTDGWNLVTSTKSINLEVSSDAHGGSKALTVRNSSNNSAGTAQLITEINGGKNYRGSGFGMIINDKTEYIFFRIAWYESSDGSGMQLETNDSNRISDKNVWQEMKGEFQAPAKAMSAKFRLMVNGIEGNESSGKFDDLKWEEIVPTPTLSVTVIPTPTPSEKVLPSSTPTITPTSVPTIEIVSDESDEQVLATSVPSENEMIHSEITKLPTNIVQAVSEVKDEIKTNEKESSSTADAESTTKEKMAIGSGLILIISGGGWLWAKYSKLNP